MVNSILEQFNYFIKREGIELKVNDTTEIKALIKEIEDNTENDEKYIYTPLDTIKQGDYVNVLGQDWLVSKKDINFNDIYEKGTISMINFDVVFNFEGELITLPSVVQSQFQKMNSGQYVTLYEGKSILTVKDTPDARRVVLNQRFLNQNRAWVVNGIDKTRKGILIFSCELSMLAENDDVENNIVDRWLYETRHEYSISIVQGQTLNVDLGTTSYINVEVKDFNVVVTENIPSYEIISTDENVITVDSVGTVTPIALGSASIIARLIDNPSISTSIEVTVNEAPIVDNYAIEITSSNGTTNAIKLGQALLYTANITNNSTTVTDKTVNWSVVNEDGTSNVYVSVIETTGTTITLKGSSNSSYVNKYFLLKAVLSDDNTITAQLRIQLKSIF